MTSTMPRTTPTAADYADGLRRLADMIEANPDIRAAYLDRPDVWHVTSADQAAAIIRAGKAAGAEIVKEYGDDMRNVGIRFGVVQAMALAMKESVCERVVVGTETVQVPDPAYVRPDVPTIPQQRDITEWRCRPFLAGASS